MTKICLGSHLDASLAAVPRDCMADWGRCDRRDERRLPGGDGEYRRHVDMADLVDMVEMLDLVYMILTIIFHYLEGPDSWYFKTLLLL